MNAKEIAQWFVDNHSCKVVIASSTDDIKIASKVTFEVNKIMESMGFDEQMCVDCSGYRYNGDDTIRYTSYIYQYNDWFIINRKVTCHDSLVGFFASKVLLVKAPDLDDKWKEFSDELTYYEVVDYE